jgi:hypothetical protein
MKAFMSSNNLRPYFGEPILFRQEDAIDEAKRILAETEPAYGACFHVQKHVGDLAAGAALAEALENFLAE